MTSRPAPFESIVSIPSRLPAPPLPGVRLRPQVLAKPDAASPFDIRVLVFDAVHHATHEVQAESSGPALLDREVHFRVRYFGNVETLDIIIGQHNLDSPLERGNVDIDVRRATRGVLHHVGKELLEREVDRVEKSAVDAVGIEKLRGEGYK